MTQIPTSDSSECSQEPQELVPVKPEMEVCLNICERLSSVLLQFEPTYGKRPYDKEVLLGVSHILPKFLTEEGALSVAIENVLLTQDIKDLRLQIQKMSETIEILGLDEVSIQTNTDGSILSVNRKMIELSGYTEAELLGKNMSVFGSTAQGADFWKDFWKTISSWKIWEGEVCERRKDGKTFCLHTIVTPIIEDGKVVSYRMTSHDVTEKHELQKLNERMLMSKIHFPSGLPNRLQLMEDLENTEYSTIAVLHISHMSDLNKAFGLEVGDAALIAVGGMLYHRFSGWINRTYKMEGTDFAILFRDSVNEEMIGLLKEFLSELDFHYEGVRIPISFSVGMVNDGSKGKEMLTRAFIALHESQETKNPIVIFREGMFDSAYFREHLEMISLVKQAIEHDLFIPFYQEIHDNFPKGDSVRKVECLARMKNPSDPASVVSPGLFLPAAKKWGQMRSITRLMVEKSFAELAHENTRFSINLSPEDVVDMTFVKFIENALKKYEINPDRIIFEVLEWVDSSKSELVNAIVHALKSLWCRIAIDDFGTENANLTRMIDFSVDFIKIDMKYVRWIDSSKRNQSLLRHIIAYAHDNGIKVIAEGVETEKEQAIIVSLGADYSQGYLFSIPAPRKTIW